MSAKSNPVDNVESDSSDHPVYQKLSYNLITLAIIAMALYLGSSIIIPLLFAILLASLLLPSSRYLESKRVNKVLSILLPLIFSLLFILSVLYFLSTQIAHFFDDIPELKARLNLLTRSLQNWIAQNFNIATSEQAEYISETTEKVKTVGPAIVGKTFLNLTETISYLVLLPIYTFLILYYKDTLKQFFVELFKDAQRSYVIETLKACRRISQRYISGLLIETGIVFSLNAIGFVILGIKYGIFLALMAALLNLIPYIGMLIANILSVLVTLVSSDNPADALWVAGVLAVVQIFDNNFGMPLIVGNNVRINALVTIIGVLVGGALCGVPGMFLAIPGLAVLKIIFERVPGLNPWALLLGDTTPAPETSLQKKIKSRRSKQEKVES